MTKAWWYFDAKVSIKPDIKMAYCKPNIWTILKIKPKKKCIYKVNTLKIFKQKLNGQLKNCLLIIQHARLVIVPISQVPCTKFNRHSSHQNMTWHMNKKRWCGIYVNETANQQKKWHLDGVLDSQANENPSEWNVLMQV